METLSVPPTLSECACTNIYFDVIYLLQFLYGYDDYDDVNESRKQNMLIKSCFLV